MSQEVLYSSGRAAHLAGVSEGSLRNYTQGGRFGALYADLFSAGVAPGPGQPRQFTAADVAILRYIRERTRLGLPHERIAAEVRAGALDASDWQPPTESAADVRAERAGQVEATQEEGPTAALVVVQEVARQLAGVMAAQLQDAQALNQDLAAQILDAERRAAAAEREAQLRTEEAVQLRTELAKLRNRGLVGRIFNQG